MNARTTKAATLEKPAKKAAPPTKGERLEARALDTIHALREAAADGCVSRVSALRIAKLIEDALNVPYDRNVIHGPYPHLSDVSRVLRDYGARIDMILREPLAEPRSHLRVASAGAGL